MKVKTLFLILLATMAGEAIMLGTGGIQTAQAGACYGQLQPICGIGQKPVCVCNGNIGQNCSYVCLPTGK